ncbi:hypothetical protein PR048_011677 [Dryococelus australis]|uniref:RNA-directed DNA polymerase n=1 Tax=Dryococelus australis TaxID=614101 RepID=A0ABQ9HM67_9NEOP|nr:hypothetical protein PR048_011677 [Dryococelus australis]
MQVGRTGRWIARLDNFRFKVIHFNGKGKVIAGCLFRKYDESDYDISEWQRKDNKCQDFKEKIEQGAVYSYRLDKELIYYVDHFKNKKVYVSSKARDLFSKYSHSLTRGGHIGRTKSMALIKREFCWPNMNVRIDTSVKECRECQLVKQPVISKVGPLGNNCILILVDGLSKCIIFIPLGDMKAGNIVKALVDRVWSIFGGHETMISDNATYLNSRLVSWGGGGKHIKTSPFYHCPNLVERVNKNIKVGFRIFHTVFHQVKFLRHEFPSPLLNAWVIPPEALDCRSLKELETIWSRTCVNLKNAMKSLAKKYNCGRQKNFYQVGDLVVCGQVIHSKKIYPVYSKLAMSYYGPFKILRFLDPVTV